MQCLDVDVATQGGSESEALENMIEALELHIQQPSGRRGACLEQTAGAKTVELSLKLSPAAAHWMTTTSLLEPAGFLPFAVPSRSMLFRHLRFKLEAAGFRGIHQRPNHAKFFLQQENDALTAILPHYTEIARSVLASIQRQCGREL